jgi:NADPH2:quinone reductase
VQLARHFEADVTAVCNTKNLELVRSLGADRVIDYTREDFTKNRQTYDVIFDAVGKHSFRRCRDSLNSGGSTWPLTALKISCWRCRHRSSVARKWCCSRCNLETRKKDVVLFLKELIEAGRYRAVIDRSYPLESVVDATRYVETERKTGNVVVTVSRA